MATQLQIRRGTTAQMNAFTGAEGELAVNTTTDTLHVHDGATAGGKALARADGSNIATYAGSFTTLAASGAATLNTLASSGATLTGGTINGVTVGASTPSTGAFTTIAASGAITGNVTGNLTGSILTAAQTNITSVGTLSTLAVTGAITANGGIDVDNINIDGTTIALSSGDLTLDAAGKIILDGDEAGATVHLKDGGVHWGSIYRSSSNFNIKSETQDKDIVFLGNDGGSEITALTLDMSEAGAATFSSSVTASPSGGVVTLGTSGHITSKQSLDVATAGGRFIGSSNRGTLGQLRIEQTANSTDGGYLAFDTSPSGSTSPQQRMVIDASGNVGIGVVPKTWQSNIDALQVGLGGSFAGNTVNPSRVYLSANYYINSSNQESYIATDEASQYFQNAGTHTFKVAPSGTADSAISWITAATIDNSGNVGIGTSSPHLTSSWNRVLHVQSAGTGSSIRIADSVSGTSGEVGLLLGQYSNDSYFVNRDSGGVYFFTNNTERFFISSVGAIFATGVRSSSAANSDLRYNTSNGELYYQTSSERYKSNIVDLEFDTSNLYNLRPVSFDDNETGERCFGLIAEETFEQIPEIVVTKDIDEETVPDSIPYSMLSVLIINEMKNLKAENDSLRLRIEALENN